MIERHRCAAAAALLLSSAWIAVPAARSGEADSLTVRECIERSQARALEVQAAGAGLNSSRLEAEAARSNARPELHLHSSAWVAPDGYYDPTATNLGEYDLRLVSTMPLYDGGALGRERSRAGLNASLAENDLTGIRREVANRTAELAIGILQTSAGIGRRLGSREWTESMLRTLQAGARGGVRSPSDVARLVLEVRTLTVELEDLEADRNRQGRELGSLLRPDSMDFSFTQVRDSVGADGPPSAADTAQVLHRFEGASDVTRTARELELARLDLANARGQRAPKLGATLDAGLLGTDLTRAVPPDVPPVGSATFSDRLKRDLGASFTLDFLLPLVQPGNSATVSARESALRAAEIRASASLIAARRSAFDLLSRWQTAARHLEAQRESAALAEAHALRNHSLYLSGAASLLELLDARKLFDESLDRVADARAELRVARLEAEIGR